MPPLRIAILTIGSLFWRDEGLRCMWRVERLQVSCSIHVKVPIKYGRKSKNQTYTMTFAPVNCMGTALVLPCCVIATEFTHLQTEAEALWRAECNKNTGAGQISATWGAVGAIFRDRQIHREWLTAWSQFFQDAGGRTCAAVDTAGLIDLPWPTRVDGQELDCDVLLATTNVQTGSPSATAIADAWIDQPGHEEYFFQNVRYGIRTQDDAEIWRRMQSRGGDLVARIGERFPEAIKTLSGYTVP